MKTSELIGPALDWAVEFIEGGCRAEPRANYWLEKWVDPERRYLCESASTNWAQGGPIIERERIRIDCPWNPGPFEATCKIDGVTGWCKGPTILIAAMRCYCCAKLGDEIDIPEELQPCQQPNL